MEPIVSRAIEPLQRGGAGIPATNLLPSSGQDLVRLWEKETRIPNSRAMSLLKALSRANENGVLSDRDAAELIQHEPLKVLHALLPGLFEGRVQDGIENSANLASELQRVVRWLRGTSESDTQILDARRDLLLVPPARNCLDHFRLSGTKRDRAAGILIGFTLRAWGRLPNPAREMAAWSSIQTHNEESAKFPQTLTDLIVRNPRELIERFRLVWRIETGEAEFPRAYLGNARALYQSLYVSRKCDQHADDILPRQRSERKKPEVRTKMGLDIVPRGSGVRDTGPDYVEVKDLATPSDLKLPLAEFFYERAGENRRLAREGHRAISLFAIDIAHQLGIPYDRKKEAAALEAARIGTLGQAETSLTRSILIEPERHIARFLQAVIEKHGREGLKTVWDISADLRLLYRQLNDLSTFNAEEITTIRRDALCLPICRSWITHRFQSQTRSEAHDALRDLGIFAAQRWKVPLSFIREEHAFEALHSTRDFQSLDGSLTMLLMSEGETVGSAYKQWLQKESGLAMRNVRGRSAISDAFLGWAKSQEVL